MKDKATEWLMGLNPFEKVKGHTKIELTDVKTGKKQIIEKDNAFQAGVLASYMRSMGAYNNNPYANSTWAGQPIWRNLCGGIFCFADPIDLTNGEVEYMPAGNEMVANGAYMVNNAGTPIELGSYNEVESSTSGNDSVTFVYDWMTHQGNGTISCVCLSTEIGGYIGYGNKSGVAASTKKGLTANQNSNSLQGVVYKNCRYTFSVSNSPQQIVVTKKPTEITKGSIFDNIAEDTETIAFTGNTVTWGYSGRAVYIGNGKIALLCNSAGTGDVIYWNSGSTVTPLIIYDIENGTAQSVTITNTTGYQVYMRFFTGLGFGIDDENIFVQRTLDSGAPREVFAINYIDGQSTSKSIGFLDHVANWQQNMTRGGILLPKMTMMDNIIWDKENDTIYPTNGLARGYSYNEHTDTLESTDGADKLIKNPLILSTINNLETPVTKTAAQTMKITYTLSKASE